MHCADGSLPVGTHCQRCTHVLYWSFLSTVHANTNGHQGRLSCVLSLFIWSSWYRNKGRIHIYQPSLLHGSIMRLKLRSDAQGIQEPNMPQVWKLHSKWADPIATLFTHLPPPPPSCNQLSLYNLPHQQGVCHKTFPGLKCWHYFCAFFAWVLLHSFCTTNLQCFSYQKSSFSTAQINPLLGSSSHFPDDLLHANFLPLLCQPFLPREYLP